MKLLTCREDTIVQVVVELMSENSFGSVMVPNNNQVIISVLTKKDIMNKFVNKRKVAEETLVSEIMTKDVKVVRETEYVSD